MLFCHSFIGKGSLVVPPRDCKKNMSIVEEHKENFNKAIDHLKHEITGLRTGRATPAIVEDVSVEAYGTRQPMKAVASITVQDAKTIAIEPWDKGLVQAIETAIRSSDLGMNPINDGRLVRINLPELTQERRQELIKVLHKKLEEARVSVRKIREEVRENVQAMEKNKEISEDEKFKLQDSLEEVVKEYNDKIRMIGEEKETEVNTI
ncbi:MAG TPA: ribosome recycling factor [Candidatus Magasanikbacteria bacterium]|nr:ribosome recycling factor [Candidatus Magasanikbacteria bacterium]